MLKLIAEQDLILDEKEQAILNPKKNQVSLKAKKEKWGDSELDSMPPEKREDYFEQVTVCVLKLKIYDTKKRTQIEPKKWELKDKECSTFLGYRFGT